MLIEMQIFLARVGKVSLESSEGMSVGERLRALSICNKIAEEENRQNASYEGGSAGVSGVANMG